MENCISWVLLLRSDSSLLPTFHWLKQVLQLRVTQRMNVPGEEEHYLWENKIYHSWLFWLPSILFILLPTCRTHPSPLKSDNPKGHSSHAMKLKSGISEWYTLVYSSGLNVASLDTKNSELKRAKMHPLPNQVHTHYAMMIKKNKKNNKYSHSERERMGDFLQTGSLQF